MKTTVEEIKRVLKIVSMIRGSGSFFSVLNDLLLHPTNTETILNDASSNYPLTGWMEAGISVLENGGDPLEAAAFCLSDWLNDKEIVDDRPGDKT
jgi:hypothetical protein